MIARTSKKGPIDREGLVFLYLILGAGSGFGQSWTNLYSGGSARALAVDSSRKSVYVTGYSSGASNQVVYSTIAYSTAGAPEWTNVYNGPNGGSGGNLLAAPSMALDTASGNVYVAGYDAASEFVTVAYSGAGVASWTNRYAGGRSEGSKVAVTADASRGNAYASGTSAGTPGNTAYGTVAYSMSGGPLWTNLFSEPASGLNESAAVAVDTNNGNDYVTGNSVPDESFEWGTVAYSSTGAPLWTQSYSGPVGGNCFATAMAVDDSRGIVYVTGSAQNTNDNDYATIAYSSAGEAIWTNLYENPEAVDAGAFEIAAGGAAGNVYVTGTLDTGGVSAGCATVVYSAAGVPLWTNIFAGNNMPRGIVVDTAGNAYVTGIFIDLNYTWTVGYSAAGTAFSTNVYTVGGSSVEGIAVDSEGNVYICGTQSTSYFSIKYARPLQIITTNPAFGLNGGLFGFDVSGPIGSSVIVQFSPDLQSWMPVQTNTIDSGTFHFSADQSTTGSHFYRACIQQ